MSRLVCQMCFEEFDATRSDAKWCPICRAWRAKERSKQYELHSKIPCPNCEKPMVRGAQLCKPCDNKSRIGRMSSVDSPWWRGGSTRDSNGYRYIRRGRKYGAEHRLV